MERGINWFLKERIFGGLVKLKDKYYFPFAILVALIATINTTIAILYQLGIFVSLEFVQYMLLMQLFVALGLIVAGFFVGKISHLGLYYTIAFLLIGLFIGLFYFFEWEYYSPLFQYTKLIFFLVWVLISCASMFVLLLYFFTSFPKKIMMLGAPKGHVFFSPYIRFILLISVPVYLYMIYQFSYAGLIIGIFGILNAIIVYRLIKRTPEKFESRPGLPNFVGAIGFFQIFLFYHLVVSFSYTSTSLSSLIIDILILFTIILYIIQSLTRRIVDSPERVKAFENPVRFQTRLYMTDRLKKTIGEPGLVLIVMGLALGYQMVYLDSFFVTQFPILSEFFTPGIALSALYHRVYLIISLIIISFAIITFHRSKKFQELMIDKYTLAQVWKYVGFYFQRQEGGVSPIEFGLQQVGKKLGEGIKNLGDKWRQAIDEKRLPPKDKPNPYKNTEDNKE